MNKDVLSGLAMRLAPFISGGLTTYGVTGEHAEAIALGLIAAGITAIEMWQRHRKAKNG